MSGFIYFAVRDGYGFIKVGRSGNVGLRVSGLRGEARARCHLIGAVVEARFDDSGCGLRERDVHRILAPHRLGGEWYWPRPEVLAFIADMLRRHGIPRSEIWFPGPWRGRRLTRGADLLHPVLA